MSERDNNDHNQKDQCLKEQFTGILNPIYSLYGTVKEYRIYVNILMSKISYFKLSFF